MKPTLTDFREIGKMKGKELMEDAFAHADKVGKDDYEKTMIAVAIIGAMLLSLAEGIKIMGTKEKLRDCFLAAIDSDK